jgi:hypothetical protein
MDRAELASLLKVLTENGVTHYKTADLEMVLAPIERMVQAPREVEDKIKTKIEEVSSILSMSDTQLVDRMFPVSSDEMTG